jgi:RNA-directed DNA polymerase
VNTGASWSSLSQATSRVLGIQIKLHRWANDDAQRRFDDLFNLVCDPAFLLLAWHRVKGNAGARSAGVDGRTARDIEQGDGGVAFLTELRADLKARMLHPLPVRERMIPKRGGTLRRLGIPTVRDRVVQAALKLVLEPIFEADFQPSSYGFRPKRRAQDAIAEIHLFTTNRYEWVLDADITACFDEIDHVALMRLVRERVGDNRVLTLVKAFLKSGILSEDAITRETHTGTPQGGILSPLLTNIALSVLDDHFAEKWQQLSATPSAREWRRRKGLANYRLVRYADDFVVLVAGNRADVDDAREEVAGVLAPVGLRLSETKTKVCHIDEGFDFLGFRIQRQPKPGTSKQVVYTYPNKAALAAVKLKVRTITRQGTNSTLTVLLNRLNPVLRGWTNYFRHGVSKETFNYLSAFAWRRVVCWLRHKHPRANWKRLRGLYLPGWWPTQGDTVLFDASTVTVSRYRYRGAKIATPWSDPTTATS